MRAYFSKKEIGFPEEPFGKLATEETPGWLGLAADNPPQLPANGGVNHARRA